MSLILKYDFKLNVVEISYQLGSRNSICFYRVYCKQTFTSTVPTPQQLQETKPSGEAPRYGHVGLI